MANIYLKLQRKLMKKIIEQAADRAVAEYLDRPYILSRELAIFSDHQSKGDFYPNIPFENVVGLEKRNEFKDCVTIRDTAYRLHCEGWDERKTEVLAYFNSPLRDNEFPVTGSRKPLTMHAIGDAAYCFLGNHRLPAMFVYNAYSSNFDEVLKEVKCTKYGVNESLFEILTLVSKGEGRLYYYHVDSYDKFILLETGLRWTLYRNKRSLGQSDKEDFYFHKVCSGFFEWSQKIAFCLFSPVPKSSYKELPQRISRLFLGDSLLNDAEE